MPGPGAPAAGQPAPSSGEAGKSAEPKATKKDDHSDDPFSSSSSSEPAPKAGADSAKPGKSTTAGALGRAFLNAGRASIPGAGGKAGK